MGIARQLWLFAMLPYHAFFWTQSQQQFFIPLLFSSPGHTMQASAIGMRQWHCLAWSLPRFLPLFSFPSHHKPERWGLCRLQTKFPVIPSC